ncbi:MAG: MXAN_5808 family serine peptidase [Candidatus Loosdrechtia sp.]|uniref:MXAN_5808 family serine peptidase n=1 Tax=Candidatus Loosdrechtia sp. TaxID=3101272 RepID=UPI003A763DEE|nr:MAG: MXAN_5808 family serine peptidase [Candidatus Jettenia sp. AMX2]
MKRKHTFKYLLIIFLFLFSVSCFFITPAKNFALESFFEKPEWKEDINHKFHISGIVMSYVNRLYVDPNRIKTLEMLRGALAWEERIIPEVIIDFPENATVGTVTVYDVSKTYDLSKIRRTKDMIEVLRDALGFINRKRQPDEHLTVHDIEYAAINGMLAQLDPHSMILPPKEFNEFKIGTTGKFGGLGMVVGLRDGQLTVISPIEGTPAARSGIKAGDKIVEIDGESTINMNLTECVGKLRGDPDTEVTLSIVTEKDIQPRVITLKREIINIPTVESASLGNGFGYIKIRNFQDDTSQSLNEHLKRLKRSDNEIRGLVLDLRNNSGGLLDQAVEVADRFLNRGAIVFTVGPGGHPREAQEARRSDTNDTDYPIVILVDGGSASGAEIVAGALKENNRAVVVGDRSFGKGSVQQLIELMDGSGLKLTIAKYLTPLLTDIQSVGITPDIQLTPVTVSKDTINLFRGLKVFREEDLKHHLEEHRAEETPFATLKYFQETSEKDDSHNQEPEEELSDPYKLPDFDKDFHVIFARKLLMEAPALHRETFLKNALPIIEETVRLEEEKIAQALQKLDIDWSKGSVLGTAKSVVEFSTHPSEKKVKAGDKIMIKVSVTNNGNVPLYQLRGISSSKNALFDKLEFILGKVEKGTTKSYSTTVAVPKNSLDRKDEIVIKFEELNQHNPEDIKFNIITEALPRPVFAYSYQIRDCEKRSEINNGDGLIQPGEDVDLLVSVKNIGEGVSEKNIVTLRNLNNKEVLVKNGRAELGELHPGERKEVTLTFFVKETIFVDDFTMDLIITDTIFGTSLSNKLKFPVMKTRSELLQDTTYVKVNRNRTPLYGGMSFDSPVLSLLKEGATLVSDARSTDWFRVVLSGDRYGWIPAKGVAVSDSIEDNQFHQEPFIHRKPPLITLTKALPGLLTGNDRLTLSAVIEDDSQVKHAYVLVNNDKVFFKSNKNASFKDRHRLEINKDLTLKEGPNVVTIVARDDQDLVTTRSFVTTKGVAIAKGL